MDFPKVKKRHCGVLVQKNRIGNTQNNWGPLYTSGSLTALNIAFPFTFSAVPTITANLSCNGVGAFLMVPGSSPGPSTKSTGVYEIGRATSLSSANNFEVNCYVIGKV